MFPLVNHLFKPVCSLATLRVSQLSVLTFSSRSIAYQLTCCCNINSDVPAALTYHTDHDSNSDQLIFANVNTIDLLQYNLLTTY